MKSLFTVASFTIKEMVKKKSFIVSNIIFLIIILVGTNIPRIINNFNNGDGSLTKLLIVDENNKFNGSLDSLKENDIGYDISIVNEKYDENYIKELIENEEFDEVIELASKGKINLAKYIDDIVTLDDVQKAYERLTNGMDDAIKILVDPNKHKIIEL